jgi:hypothetical protein
MKTLLLTLAVAFTALPCIAQQKPPAPEAGALTGVDTSEKPAALELMIREQQAAVEKARQEMLEIMKRHHIVDFQSTPGAPPANGSAALSVELEALHAKAEPAQQADFDRWLDHSLALCAEDANFRQTYTALLQSAADLAKLKASGLGERHPKIMAMEAALKGHRKQLSFMAAQRRERLRKELLDGVKATEASQAAESAGPGGANEYLQAKRDYEAASEGLRKLREKALEERLRTPPLPHEAAEAVVDKEKK